MVVQSFTACLAPHVSFMLYLHARMSYGLALCARFIRMAKFSFLTGPFQYSIPMKLFCQELIEIRENNLIDLLQENSFLKAEVFTLVVNPITIEKDTKAFRH